MSRPPYIIAAFLFLIGFALALTRRLSDPPRRLALLHGCRPARHRFGGLVGARQFPGVAVYALLLAAQWSGRCGRLVSTPGRYCPVMSAHFLPGCGSLCPRPGAGSVPGAGSPGSSLYAWWHYLWVCMLRRQRNPRPYPQRPRSSQQTWQMATGPPMAATRRARGIRRLRRSRRRMWRSLRRFWQFPRRYPLEHACFARGDATENPRSPVSVHGATTISSRSMRKPASRFGDTAHIPIRQASMQAPAAASRITGRRRRPHPMRPARSGC